MGCEQGNYITDRATEARVASDHALTTENSAAKREWIVRIAGRVRSVWGRESDAVMEARRLQELYGDAASVVRRDYIDMAVNTEMMRGKA